MVAILASHGCHSHRLELMNPGKAVNNSSSISIQNFSKYERETGNLPTDNRYIKFQVEGRQIESPTVLGTNGRATKMVPASEVMKRKQAIHNVDSVNGSKRVVNGASIVKKDTAPGPLVKSKPNVRNPMELPPVEELKVLPSDEGFSWANDNYNSLQRSIDVWSFVLSLRLRVLFDNAKWAYVGGFSEDKQVTFSFMAAVLNCFLIDVCVSLSFLSCFIFPSVNHFLFFPFFFWLKKTLQKNRRRKTASWLRERVLQLGPTFIKLGQLSSTRSDLFPTEFVEELAKLQVLTFYMLLLLFY